MRHAPTVTSSSVHLLSAIPCECDLDLFYFHLEQTFIPLDLEEDAIT